ncbi:ATP-binding protein [Undibacterium cyanobacteriorum]|uniref:histidine kinase n=1 Tax=Undibacterium cyanobacteriorum TaxID=3073561 RepID=A0ABY9RGE1_9BURK|nr:ATP-binding protein [Undibacterium sp. 20NA77.5]WMW79734.1 ATP-binding protein [Undibacterium sp. 20NA77.5]
MRLSIAKKISLSVILILVMSVSGLAWLSSRSLQSGFNTYLKEKQQQELVKVAKAFAGYYRAHGSFADLWHNPQVVRPILNRALDRGMQSEAELGDAPPPERARPEGRPPPRDRRAASRPEGPPLGMEFGPRLSLLDAHGEPVFGPLRNPNTSLQSPVEVDGQRVGTMLAPIPEFQLEKTTADFVGTQIRHILTFAIVLLALATLASIWLGQHLVKPIASLRRVTQEIARGRLHTRVEVERQDELGSLAEHINRMASALEANETKRRKIMADMSHELRTPLTVMRAEVEALIDGVRPLNQEAIRSIEAEIQHLNKLVEDLHQLALADSGGLRFQFSQFDLIDLLKRVSERMQARLREVDLRLILDLPEHPVMLEADASRLTQVLENLFENSMRYTNAGGSLRLCVRQQAGLVTVTVEDSEPGLGDGNYEALFERLYREDQARSRAKGGSGLGLAICKTIIQAHYGEIKACASALGGLKIEFLLPSQQRKQGQ